MVVAVKPKAATTTTSLLLTAAAVHGDLQVATAVALLPAAGTLRGDSAPLPVRDVPPPRPHRWLHRTHGPLPPLLPLPCRPPPLPSAVPPPHLTDRRGLLPLLLSVRSHPLFRAARYLSTCSASDGDEEEVVGDSPPRADPSHPEHVGRVCAAIADVVAAGADANLEAALTALSPPLSEALVLAVLDRFKHAHRPSHRFFRWAAASGGFAHTSITYCKMVHILGKTRQFHSMVALIQEMGKEGALCMDAFKIAIKSFAAAGEIKNAVGVFEMMKTHGFDDGVESFNCLLVALAQEGLGREANQVFDRMRNRYTPDLRSYTALMLAWCNARNLVEAGRVWNEMLENGMKPDVVVHNTMIEGLLRGQRRPEAVKMFELMKAKGPAPNVWTYTMLIRDHCKKGKMDMAMRCFEEMQDVGCEPDVATYTCLLVGYGNAKRMDRVTALLEEMTEKGCPPDGRTYNALIKLLTNRNMPDDAARIYKKMIKKGLEPTIHTYNMMMKSYFLGGRNYMMGCAVWEEMHQKGICPDVNSYTVFINGHIRHGRPKEACKYIEEMIQKGMKAPQIDYNKFAADFSKAGKPDILYELAQKVKFTGKFDASNVFHHWAERMKKRVKQTVPNQTESRTL
ncbi:pentatricopeptide repeat-containing protein At3g62470, mitochondrial-like [Oryza brachyantha]|uniref:pentatricopeptide repeat-containing protein At3g62470, mitochondrial-like n=1 Tax=Oryza brachyantha TaxID=4533 RepID=UPI001ADA8B26|nr:pentatricopeptide repeat-containing protein At3g62470, mitochondrial-like [Oryza brachyantha]